MRSEDEKRPQPSLPLRRAKHRYNNMIDAFSRPRCYCIILLVTFFVLGYLYHSQPATSLIHFDQSPPPPAKMSANDDFSTPSSSHPCTAPPVVPPSHHTPTTPPDDSLAAHDSFPKRCAPQLPLPRIRQTILHTVFNGVSPWEGFPPPHAAPLLLQEWTKGWGSRAAVFKHLIAQVRPKTIIEVGTFLGASATHMVGLTKKLGLHDTLILCIDDFRGWPGYSDEEKSIKMVNGDSMLLYQFMHNVAKANATESIMFLPFSTSTALGELCDWGVYGDLVEIDAAHDFHSAWVDINNGYKVLRRPGGVIFGHDYAWPGVRRAVDMFARLHDLQVRKHGEHWILY